MENGQNNAQKPSPDDVLTAQQAADLAGMSRSSFLSHVGEKPDDVKAESSRVESPRIFSDVKVGTRECFRRSTVQTWIRERERLGVKKRGPKSQREQAAA